jgi:hypothetical protein
MPDARQADRAAYDEARSAFDKLDPQDKVAFAVEAAFSAAGQGIEAVGRMFASLVDDVAEDFSRATSGRRGEPSDGPRPEQPPREPSGPGPAAGGAARAKRKPPPKRRPKTD